MWCELVKLQSERSLPVVDNTEGDEHDDETMICRNSPVQFGSIIMSKSLLLTFLKKKQKNKIILKFMVEI